MTQGDFDGPGTDRVDTGDAAKAIYVLYLLGLLIGVTQFVGLVMAYVYRGGAPAWLRSHYTYQIRTFWIGLLYIIVGGILSFIYIGYFVLLFWLVWYVIRCAKGLKRVGEGRGVFFPETWWF